jgi:acid phosphatase family membrane protein YuiD
MTGLAYSVGLIEGFTSVVFAVALGIAMVVMYDAAGVRQAAGKMAGILNRLTEDIYTHHPDKVPERLRELLGHTPYEVMVGALLGVCVAIMLHVRLAPI